MQLDDPYVNDDKIARRNQAHYQTMNASIYIRGNE